MSKFSDLPGDILALIVNAEATSGGDWLAVNLFEQLSVCRSLRLYAAPKFYECMTTELPSASDIRFQFNANGSRRPIIHRSLMNAQLIKDNHVEHFVKRISIRDDAAQSSTFSWIYWAELLLPKFRRFPGKSALWKRLQCMAKVPSKQQTHSPSPLMAADCIISIIRHQFPNINSIGLKGETSSRGARLEFVWKLITSCSDQLARLVCKTPMHFPDLSVATSLQYVDISFSSEVDVLPLSIYARSLLRLRICHDAGILNWLYFQCNPESDTVVFDSLKELTVDWNVAHNIQRFNQTGLKLVFPNLTKAMIMRFSLTAADAASLLQSRTMRSLLYTGPVDGAFKLYRQGFNFLRRLKVLFSSGCEYEMRAGENPADVGREVTSKLNELLGAGNSVPEVHMYIENLNACFSFSGANWSAVTSMEWASTDDLWPLFNAIASMPLLTDLDILIYATDGNMCFHSHLQILKLHGRSTSNIKRIALRWLQTEPEPEHSEVNQWVTEEAMHHFPNLESIVFNQRGYHMPF